MSDTRPDLDAIKRRLAREEKTYGDPMEAMHDDLVALVAEVERLTMEIMEYQSRGVYELGWDAGSITTWRAMAELIRNYGDRNVIGALTDWESRRGFGSSAESGFGGAA